jgi:hypothetical protein
MISIHAIIGRVKHWWGRGAWGLGTVLVIVFIGGFFWFMVTLIQNANAEYRQLQADRGVTIPMNERELSYSPSGVEYFVDCIEGREFIVSNPNTDRYAIAGPINDKECE